MVSNYVYTSFLRSNNIYVNSLTYSVYKYISFFTAVQFNTLSLIMYGILGIILIGLLYTNSGKKEHSERSFLSYTSLALISIVIFNSYRSPQYMFWFTPLLCLLIANDFEKIKVFWALQLLNLIEYPFAFGSIWNNASYLNPIKQVPFQ